jgi:hypothetical protein
MVLPIGPLHWQVTAVALWEPASLTRRIPMFLQAQKLVVEATPRGGSAVYETAPAHPALAGQ